MSISTPNPAISDTVRTFLAGIVDYAGLFPPASLNLDNAIRNFARYRRHEDSWMLSSFVCPASRLVELEAYRDLLTAEERHPFSVLGVPSSSLEEWTTATMKLRDALEAFHTSMGEIASTRAVEVKLPLAVALDAGERREAVRTLLDVLSGGSFDIFVEISPAADASAVRDLAHELLERDRERSTARTALKIRTGGVTPPEIPDADSVAAFILACRDTGIRFKATAGLHHPLRHFSKTVGDRMHGFLNVFAGAMAAAEYDLSRGELREIFETEQADYFVFTDTRLEIGELNIDRKRVQVLRQEFATSFGSCSFDEPRDDLRSMGLL
ncbi:MAG: hypothetical protein KJO98_03060 [Rhodothermia bacterium]|nr:hypothetical protein [Rhodothermia bacterium]